MQERYHREVGQMAGAVRQGALRLSRRLRLERGDAGLTQQQFSVLAQLTRSGPFTPGELAAIERVQPQSLTRTIISLEQAGLVTRAAHPDDGRSALLTITVAGRRALDDDVRGRDAWLAAAMEAELTATERGLLRLAADLMTRLAASDVGGTGTGGATQAADGDREPGPRSGPAP